MKYNKPIIVISQETNEGVDIGDVRILVRKVKTRKGHSTIRLYIQADRNIPVVRFKIPDGCDPFVDTDKVIHVVKKPKVENATRNIIQNESPEKVSSNRRYVAGKSPASGDKGNS